MAANAEGIVQIRGKSYRTVAHRINEFRESHPDYSIVTELVSADDHRVIVKASISIPAHSVTSEYGSQDFPPSVLATGYAEEERGSSNINETSALENAETSAVGRALAFLGLAGTEIASADEVANAITQQKVKEVEKAYGEHMAAIREEWPSIHAIKEFLAEEVPNVDAAREAFKELPETTQHHLWRAPTKGGVFTTLERKLLKEGLPTITATS